MKLYALHDINAMIQQDLATSRQLLALLQEESESTQSRDYVAMAMQLKAKTTLLEQLKHNAQKRADWLRNLNQEANDANWQRCLQALKQPQLQQQWLEVKSTVEHCQRVNEMNGKLINRKVSVNRKLLDILRGNQPSANLYNAKGTTRASSYRHSVTQV